MKKYLATVLIFFAVIFVGCGFKKDIQLVNSDARRNDKIDAILLAKSFWVADSKNMAYLNDAISRRDEDYLKQLMIERKVFIVDKDTKITRFGAAADKNNVLILFKEGRYTNKTGCTHASNVIDEKDFSKYKENQKRKTTDLIKQCLKNTENYFEKISSGNLTEIKILQSVCLNDTNVLKSEMQDSNFHMKECIEEAVKIIFERDFALAAYKSFVEYSNKAEQENPTSKKFRVYKNMQENFKGDIDKHSQKAEKLRQEFGAKYGF